MYTVEEGWLSSLNTTNSLNLLFKVFRGVSKALSSTVEYLTGGVKQIGVVLHIYFISYVLVGENLNYFLNPLTVYLLPF